MDLYKLRRSIIGIVRYFDYNSEFDSLDLPIDVREILRTTAHNQQLFSYEDIDRPNKYTTGSIRYQKQDRDRPKFRNLADLPDHLNTEQNQNILEFFEFGDSASRFQLESWDTIQSQLDVVKDSSVEKDQAAVVHAPTGFGKTAAFLGPIFHNAVYQNGDRAILVYPSRALLKDQLSRILEVLNRVNSSAVQGTDDRISVGAWMGKQPYKKQELLQDGESFVDSTTSPATVTVANHWADDKSAFYIKRRKLPKSDPGYRVFDEDYRRDQDGINFIDKELVLHRNAIKDRDDDRPDILLTTLESLETLAAKPHYNIVLEAEYFVFDEIHQYQGLRGSHAAEIIRNIRRIREKNAVFIGSSATVDEPAEFAAKLFGFSTQAKDRFGSFSADPHDVESLSPYDDDIDESNDDALHYYFMLTDEDSEPGVAAQYLQHAMMIGRSLSRPATDQQEMMAGDESAELDSSETEEYTLNPLDQTEHRKLLAFIQSKSEINRLKSQFSNADKDNQLWKYHISKPDADWKQLSHETHHNFLDSKYDLDNPIAIYSDSETNVNQIADADIIHGTSFLEVGVDIDNLHFISQYRPPQNITTFRQRAGRAAREKGSSGHVFVHLSDYGGDTNFHYRADRFIDSNIATPIWTNNKIISWMHERFYEYYKTLQSFRNARYYDGSWSDSDNETHLIQDYFAKTLDWDRFSDLLLKPDSSLEQTVGIGTGRRDLLDDEKNLEELREKVREKRSHIRTDLNEIQEFLSEDTGDLLLDHDAVGSFIVALSTDALTLLNTLSTGEFVEKIDETKQNLESIITADDPANEIDSFLENGRAVAGLLEMEKPSIPADRYPENKVRDLRQALDQLEAVVEDGSLSEMAAKQKGLYYFQQAISALQGYRGVDIAHGQLYAIKFLFRAAYYYNRCLQAIEQEPSFRLNSDIVSSDQPPEEIDGVNPEHATIWYVPPNYFNDAGKYFTLETPKSGARRNDRTEKPVTSLLSQYIPFKIEHQPSTGVCHLFQPRVLTRGNGDACLNFSGIEGNNPEEWLRTPNRIELDLITDLSQDKAQSVFAFDEESLQIDTETDTHVGLSTLTPAEIYSSAHIETLVKQTEKQFESGNLSLIKAEAKAWIEGVDLSITPQKNIGTRETPEFKTDPNRESYNKYITSTTPKLGYELQTRAVQWDLSSFFNQYRDKNGEIDESAIMSGVRFPDSDVSTSADNYKEFDVVNPSEATYITAAHLLKLLVADVAGVNPNLLLFGYDEETQQIQVFEQTEGGQGIVDLFITHLQERPQIVLSSLYRLLHNPQILNERLWSAQRPVERLYQEVDLDELHRGSDTNEADPIKEIERIVVDEYQITYPTSRTRIAEEIRSTLERIAAQSQKDIPVENLFRLKHSLAKARVAGNCPTDEEGNCQIPDHILEEFSTTIEVLGPQTTRSLFLSPDIDSCSSNLQFHRSISNVSQDKSLSYCILEQLEQYIVDRVPAENEREEVLERKQYWAWLDDSEEEVLFLQW